MRALWKKSKNLKPRVILEKIESIKKILPDGGVSYSTFEYQDAIAALQSMVEFPNHDESIDRTAIVSAAVSGIAKRGVLSEALVIDEVNSEIRESLAKPEALYYVLTTVSLKSPYPRNMITSGTCEIRLSPQEFPKKYASRIETLRRFESAKNAAPSGYARVIIKVKAKSGASAVHKALLDLDMQRAIWSFFCNSSMELLFGGESKPINKIRLGAAHTLHDELGKSSGDQFWYEPNFTLAQPFAHADNEKFRKNVAWVNKRLKANPYRSELRDAMLRSVRALDEKDQNVALVRLWGALESLAAPSEQNYDRVTKRASFIFADRAYHEQVLEHLREYRNRNVHASEGDDRSRVACYQLQRYFVQLILFHLRSANTFRSLDEANAFLDLPSDIDALKVKGAQIKRAIKFVSPVA